MAKRNSQFALLKREPSAYGGELLTKRAGRKHSRPIATRSTMHLVLRSTQARGEWSFLRKKNAVRIDRILKKFSQRYGVRILARANVGNHFHLHIKIGNRHTYAPFIRAITSAIAMAVTGRNRWTVNDGIKRRDLTAKNDSRHETRTTKPAKQLSKKFWDRRPFTKVVESFTAYLNLKNYVRINEFEACNYSQDDARLMVELEREYARSCRTG